uniref:Secreted protein n=1 Tax=Ascaris lumbricoides TaxID=6252 RepID=A0A0M3IE56_ASCLU
MPATGSWVHNRFATINRAHASNHDTNYMWLYRVNRQIRVSANSHWVICPSLRLSPNIREWMTCVASNMFTSL